MGELEKGVAMKIGFDYWQVVSHYPTTFAVLEKALSLNGNDTYIISAVGAKKQHTVADDVIQLWPTFNRTHIHEVLFTHPRQSPQLKLAKCQELGIELFFDDREDVCTLLNQHGILALRVPRQVEWLSDIAAERK